MSSGGFPAGTFLAAGYKVGLAAKSGLWTEFARLIDEVDLNTFGVENVRACFIGVGSCSQLGRARV